MPLKDVPKGAAQLGQHVGDAALHHHQRGAVLLHRPTENIPQALADWMLGHGLGVIAFLLAVQRAAAVGRQLHGAVVIVLIFAPILFPVAMKLGIDQCISASSWW